VNILGFINTSKKIKKMEKLTFYLLSVLIVISFGCNQQKPAESTVMQYFTPNGINPVVLNGKIKKLTEKNYWALVDNGKYLKGKQITRKELDSLQWMYDYEVNFDENGLIQTSSGFDETGKTVWNNHLKIENNKYVENQYARNDTVRFYEKIRYNEKGELSETQRYRFGADTLIGTGTFHLNLLGDSLVFNFLDFKGIPMVKYIFHVGENKMHIGSEFYDKDGNYTGGNEYTYNEKDIFQKVTYFDKDKKISNWEEYIYFEYDDKGNPVISCYKDAAGRLAMTERTYTYY
jgi:hypothetical protein